MEDTILRFVKMLGLESCIYSYIFHKATVLVMESILFLKMTELGLFKVNGAPEYLVPSAENKMSEDVNK